MADTHITYLGILLTTDPHHTIDLNMKHLLSQLESETKHLSQSFLSWLARINRSKMLLLPRYLYVVWAIPYLIPPSLISKLQTLFLKFIWRDSKPRIKKEHLYQHIADEGLSVSDLLSYNRAAILEPSYILWHQPQIYRWAQIECETLPNGSVKDILAISQIHTISGLVLLSLYGTMFYKMDGSAYIDEVPITSLQFLIPHLSLNLWVAQGITHISQLYDGDNMHSYETLSPTFNLPKSYFYQYLQTYNHFLITKTLLWLYWS